MKIGIISDTHGSLPAWERAMEIALRGADCIIHCGDILYHGPKFRPATGYDPLALAREISASPAPVLIARGNADSDVDQLVLEVPMQQPYLFTQMEGLRILASHGHLAPLEQLIELAQRWRVDLLVTGHSHVPTVERHGSLVHINPGSVTYPLSTDPVLRHRTCATFTNRRAAIYRLTTGRELLA